MSEVAAVILAGGTGERLGGVVKANLRVGGARLLERVSRGVAGARPVLVAQGSIPPGTLFLSPDQVPVADPPGPVAGPLAGLAAAVDWLTVRPAPPAFLLSVAVDTPFFPASFLASALAAIGKTDAVVARYAGQVYPTNALWRLSALAGLPSRLLAGSAPMGLKRLLEGLDTRPLDWPEEQGGNPFANVNTIADLLALGRRARAHPAPDFGVGKQKQTG